MDQKFCVQLNELLVTTYRAIHVIEETMLSDLSNESLSIREMHIIEAIGSSDLDPHLRAQVSDLDPHLRAQGRTITEIAQMQGISAPSVTVAVKKLERKGYVCKSRGKDDGRRIYVRLTDLGRRADISHRYFHRQMVHAVARAMPESDRAALIDGLEVLNEFFQDKADELTQKADDAGKNAARPGDGHSPAGKEVRPV